MRITPCFESPVCQRSTQSLGDTRQFHAVRVKFRHPVKDKTSPCHVHRGQCRCENQATLRVHQKIPEHLVTDHESPVGCKSLPESTHDKINIINTSLFLATPQSIRAPHPDGMRLVHVQERVVLSLQITQLLQVRHVTIHTEYGFCYDKHVLVLLPVIKQDFPQMFVIQVTIA